MPEVSGTEVRLTSGAFAPGSVSLGLSVYLRPTGELLALLVDEARAVQRAGFDGFTLSEHHGGFAGYVPNPAQAVAVTLAKLDPGGRYWGAPCPILLPLRSPALVAEELGWLAAWFPGRVAAGLAPGYHVRDFELVGADAEDRGAQFAARLTELVGLLRGDLPSPLDDDPAVRDLRADGPGLPLVVAAGSAAAARRAAVAGTGVILSPSMSPVDARRVIGVYRDNGGSGPVVLTRRVWVGGGDPEAAYLRHWNTYRQASSDDAAWLSGTYFVKGDAADLARTLVTQAVEIGATCWNLRIHAPTVSPEQVRGQIDVIGRDVVGQLHQSWNDVT